MVVDPVTVGPDAEAGRALELMRRHGICGLPVVAADGRPVGILTNRDIRFERNLDQPVGAMMTKKLITVAEGTGARERQGAPAQAPHREAARRRRRRPLKGLITIKDIEKAQKHPNAAKDELGRLRVGAAVGVGRRSRRARRGAARRPAATSSASTPRTATRAACSQAVRRRAHELPQGARSSPATSRPARATLALVKAGADAVKVGIGPGSICTTRVVAGVGVPQITAIADCAKARASTSTATDHRRRRHQVLGRRRQGDRRRRAHRDDRLAVRRHRRGAGRDHPVPGPQLQGVPRHGLDRRDAAGSRRIATSRPRSTSDAKLVPEGIEGRVPYRGRCRSRSTSSSAACSRGDGLHRLPHDRRAAHQGALRARSTATGLRESHVHDVIITKEAPNYRVEQ